MEFKGTTGKWTTSKVHNFSGTLICYVETEDGKSIAQTRGQTTGMEEECQANAKLMASAPRMLEALVSSLETINIMLLEKRPTGITDSQKGNFFSENAKEVISNGWSEYPEETISKDLRNLSLRDNGFEIAKNIEEHGHAHYNIDTCFCDWLEYLSPERDDIVNKNVKSWVKAHNIKAKLKKGDKLKVVKKFAYFFNVGDEMYVTGVRSEDATYTLDSDKNKKGGTVIEFERAENNCELIKY